MTCSAAMTERSRSASEGIVAVIRTYPRDITAVSSHSVAPTHVRPDDLATCISCGLCLNDCPTYRVLGNEADSPRGRIQLIRTLVATDAPPTAELAGHLDACLVCRACETACPSLVPFGRIMEGAREVLRDRDANGPVVRAALDTVADRRRLALFSWITRLAGRLGLT